MDNKKQTDETKLYENESVVPTREDSISSFSVYSLLVNPDEYGQELSELADARRYRKVLATVKGGNFETSRAFREALSVALSEEDTPLYKRFGDTLEEAVAKITRLLEGKAENFLDTREASFRSAFLPYLESVLLAGMRAKILVNTWWRLVNYGFSVQPYDDSEEPGEAGYKLSDFPYVSVSEMPEKDKEAFRQVTLDVYYVMTDICTLFHTTEKAREDEDYSFRPYPKEGYTASELARKWEYENEDELYESWEHDTELYLGFALFRLDEALYYAFKYKGGEYKEYLSSLNVAEDWNENYQEAKTEACSDMDFYSLMKKEA